jgi:hypothetical protein
MKFKGTEDRKKRILNNRRAALENDVSWPILQLMNFLFRITELSTTYPSHNFSDMELGQNVVSLNYLAWTLKVAQLQTKLEDEKAVRQDLERALGGPDAVSPSQSAGSNLAPQVSQQKPLYSHIISDLFFKNLIIF